MSESGSSLLEAAVALCLAGIFLAGAVQTLHGGAAGMRVVSRYEDTLTVVRNLLEAEIGARCTVAFACPAGFRCHLSRASLGGLPPLERVTARAGPTDTAAERDLELSVLVPDGGPCG